MDAFASHWSALSKLLDEALDLPAVERDAWMQRMEERQPHLATSLRKLLVAHARVETAQMLQVLPRLPPRALADIAAAAAHAAAQVAADPATNSTVRLASLPLAQPSALREGDRVGPYRLIRELGVGGMAHVWLAARADGAFERDIALKLPQISLLRRHLAERFARERDILARLEHPHIARLYDAGVAADGTPYLAMEFVAGQSIHTYCDQRKLDLTARLALFDQVLAAVQYAHANLVIHRDLKPSNILVDDSGADGMGQVRLLDFGIAKLVADDERAHETQLTALSGRAMTPDYASPEQILGEPLTIASDVYSLGVVLFELLTGARPYKLKLKSTAHLELAILDAEAASPSSALTPEAAAARGATVARLARALRGDLDTIVRKALAKQPADRYLTIAEFADDLRRLRDGQTVLARPPSWSYRSRKFVTRNRLGVGAAAAVAIALLAGTAVSLWQAQRAVEQANVARREAQRAEQVKSFVLGLFYGADISSGSSRKTTTVELLQQAQHRLATSEIKDPAIRVELLTSIGFSLIGLGEYEAAVPVLDEATQLAESSLGKTHAATYGAWLVYGEALVVRGEYERAARLLDAAIAGMRSTGNDVGLVNALRWRSVLDTRLPNTDRAIAAAVEAVQVAEAKLATSHRKILMLAHWTHAETLLNAQRPGRLAPARRAYELAKEIYGDRITPDVLGSHQLYAFALTLEGDPDLGIAEMKALLPHQVSLLGPEHNDVSLMLDRIGMATLLRGDVRSAIASFQQALTAAEKTGRPTRDLGLMQIRLGQAYFGARRMHEAEQLMRRSAETFVKVAGPDNHNTRMSQGSAALALLQLNRIKEAEALFDSLLSRPFASPAEASATQWRLGLLRSAQGKHTEAEKLLRDAVANYESTPVISAFTQAQLGFVLLEAGRANDAIAPLETARARLETAHPHGSPQRADVDVDIARALLVLQRVDDAATAAARATAFWKEFDPVNRHAGIALLWSARVQLAAGKASQAAETFQEARRILAKTGLPSDRALLANARLEFDRSARLVQR